MPSWSGKVEVYRREGERRVVLKSGSWVVEGGQLLVMDNYNNRHLSKPLSELKYRVEWANMQTLFPVKLTVDCANGDSASIAFLFHYRHHVSEICAVIDAAHKKATGATATGSGGGRASSSSASQSLASDEAPPSLYQSLPPPSRQVVQRPSAISFSLRPLSSVTPRGLRVSVADSGQRRATLGQLPPLAITSSPVSSSPPCNTIGPPSSSSRKRQRTEEDSSKEGQLTATAKDKEPTASGIADQANRQLKRLSKYFDEQKSGNCSIASGLEAEEMQPIVACEALLSRCSPVLAAQFKGADSDNVTIIIPDFTYKTVYSAIKFCYTNTLEEDEANIDQLLELAIRYEMADLHHACLNRLKEQLSARTAVKTLLIANIIKNEELMKATTAFITGNMDALEKDEGIDATKLLDLAIRHDLADLRLACTDRVKAQLTPNTAIKLLLLADRIQDAEMKQVAMNVIVANLKEVEKLADWALLDDKPRLHQQLFAEFRKLL